MKLWAKHKKAMKQVSVVDKCLLIIMLILMLQSAFNLFINESIPESASAIDIIVRTSAAAIFGYFLSGNFVKKSEMDAHEPKGESGVYVADADLSGEMPRAQIGFAVSEDLPSAQMGSAEMPSAPMPYSKHQVMIISVISVASLLILLVFRNFMGETPQAAATISQFRDFISAGVGFLVGCGRYSATRG